MRALLIAVSLVMMASAFAQGANPLGRAQCRPCATALKTWLATCGNEDCSERCRRDYDDSDCEAVCPRQNEGQSVSGQTRGSRLLMSRPQRLQAMPIVASWPPALW
jgi:hypothetical protein